MSHEKFHYRSWKEMEDCAAAQGVCLPRGDDLSVLGTPWRIGARRVENRIALQPMEGADGTCDGAPGELTRRRYLRFAAGGAGLIWFEAVAVAREVRANPRQLMLTEANLGAFQRLVEEIKETGLKENGYAPVVIMQATHSGRYSKPNGVAEPLIAYNCPPLEDAPLPESRILTDDQLKQYEALFGKTAALARRAGFDGVDIKCCHRYLASELLSAYRRVGEYGGSFENRTRFLRNAYAAARSSVGDGFFLATRMNAYDGFAYPNGFGVKDDGTLAPCYDEPKRLARSLREWGAAVLDVTMGNPYKNPHVNRPYDHGGYVPDEHPLFGVARMMAGVAEIQAEVRDIPVIGSAFSYLRSFAPELAAGMIERGGCAAAGFGRMALADPDFPKKILSGEKLDKPCLTCGGCAQLLRAGIPVGCVARDREIYTLEGVQ